MFYRSRTENHAQRLRRARPVIALASVAFAIGAIVGANHGAPRPTRLAQSFVHAWTRGRLRVDVLRRRRLLAAVLDRRIRRRLPQGAEHGHRHQHGPRGQGPLAPGRGSGGSRSRANPPVRDAGARLPAEDPHGRRRRPARGLVTLGPVPGPAPGRALSRHTTLPRRATLLARDGTVLAESPETGAAGTRATSPERSEPLGELASARGRDARPDPRPRGGRNSRPKGCRRTRSSASAASSGRSTTACGGRPGAAARGERAAAGRTACSHPRRPVAAPAVRSTVSPAVQRAAVDGPRRPLGGIVACSRRPARSWPWRASASTACSRPGSTFKMVTLTGVLAAHIASPHSVFPYATYATLDGVKLNNANGEECGGSLELAFAVSCNSVFAPLGSSSAPRAWSRPRDASASTRRRGSRGRREHAAAGGAHPGRTRRRIDGDRPGPGAGEPAARWRSWRRRSPTAAPAPADLRRRPPPCA